MAITHTTTHRPGHSLLLLLVGFLASYGACQEVRGEEVRVQEVKQKVSTKYIEVSWVRGGDWFGVTNYTVTLVPQGASPCTETVVCEDVVCNFTTLSCGELEPCTFTELTVAGGTYSAKLTPTTAPEPVTNVSLWLDMGMNVAWDNPDMFTSACFDHTVVRFTFNGETTTREFKEEEDTKFLMCVGGVAEVEVWTHGGDGDSDVAYHHFNYEGDDVVPAVLPKNCTAVGCTSILLEWGYNPVCPGAANIVLDIDDYHGTLKPLSLSTTNFTVSNLKVDQEYPSCVRVVDKEGTTLYRDCISPCHTAEEKVRNLDVFPIVGTDEPWPTYVMGASWEPSLCQSQSFSYKASIALDYNYPQTFITTTNTTYNFTSLYSPGTYTVCVHVIHYNDDPSGEVCNSDCSYPEGPYYVDVYEGTGGSFHVSWSVSSMYVDFYNVSWGEAQEYYNYTTAQDYTITGYGHVDRACVANVWNNLTSPWSCSRDQPDGHQDSNKAGLIAGCVLAGLVLVAAVVGGLGYYVQKKDRRSRDSKQELNRT